MIYNKNRFCSNCEKKLDGKNVYYEVLVWEINNKRIELGDWPENLISTEYICFNCKKKNKT